MLSFNHVSEPDTVVGALSGLEFTKKASAVRSKLQGWVGEVITLAREDKPVTVPGKMNLFYGAFNLMNDVFTSSIVSVPYFVVLCGVANGLYLLFFLAVLGHAMLLFLHQLTLERGYTSLCDACLSALGPAGYISASFSIFLFNFGGYVGALMMLIDLLPTLLAHFGLMLDGAVVLLVAVVALSPLAFKRNLDALNFVSAFGVTVNIYLVAGTITYAVVVLLTTSSPFSERGTHLHSASESAVSEGNFLEGIGGLAFLYACHDLAYDVSTSLEKPTLKRYAVVSGISMYLPFVLLATLSLFMWLLYGDSLEANLLDNFARDNLLAVILRLLLSLNIIFNIPYMVYMPRQGLISLVRFITDQQKVPNSLSFDARSNAFHNTATLLLLVIGYFMAITITDLGKVFGLVGGVSGVAVSSILPALCWLQLGSPLPYNGIVRLGLYAVVVFGVSVASLSTISCFSH